MKRTIVATTIPGDQDEKMIGIPHLPMTCLLLAVALMASFALSPVPTAADTSFARLSEPVIVAIMRHAHAPGTGDPAKLTLGHHDSHFMNSTLHAHGPASGRWLGLVVIARRLDEDVLVVPFDGCGKTTFDDRPEGRQRLLELLPFVESKRRVVAVPGLLDEALEG